MPSVLFQVADSGPGPDENFRDMHPRPISEAIGRLCDLHALLLQTHELRQIKPWITETWVLKEA